jgi:hypothetical protein
MVAGFKNNVIRKFPDDRFRYIGVATVLRMM